MAGDDITVHVEWLARRLTQQQEDVAAAEQHRIMANTHHVSRVPEHVRDHNANAYTPGLVAIGPLHAANRRLRAGTRLKMSYLNSLISRGHRDPAAYKIAWDAARLLQRLPLLLLVSLLYPTLPEKSRWSARYGRVHVGVPSATDLKLMLMQFKACGGETSGAGIVSVLGPVPLAVKLEHKDRLRLPQLRIGFRTAPLLLNLMAFEQSADQRAGDVSAYVWLMAKLVQSPEDTGVLLASEVVQAMSGSESNEDVARIFRRVGAASKAAAELQKSYLGETLHKLRERSQHPLLTKRADVQRYYVNVPWRLVAAFVTIVTTVASILQTVASFKQKP